jgi:hypothetical protein
VMPNARFLSRKMLPKDEPVAVRGDQSARYSVAPGTARAVMAGGISVVYRDGTWEIFE